MLSQLSPTRLAELCCGHWHHGATLPASFTSAQIDSRMMGQDELFIAFRGETTDGHRFVPGLNPDLGQAAIVEQPAQNATAAQLCVADSLQALQSISREVSSLTGAAKFAVTGSVGKTGTKDMLCRMLAGFGRTHATKGNYNNHIGAPLTLAQMPEDTEFLACELGMNHAGELSELAQIVKPSVAAITCIADSHIGHFTSLEEIADAKAEIFTGLADGGIAVLPRDDVFYPRLVAAATTAGATRILSFGAHPESNFRLLDCTRKNSGLVVTIDHPDINDSTRRRTVTFKLGMTARHWAMNALCGLAISGHLLCLIDDSYNAGPVSMKAALANLAEMSGHPAAVLSDMLELGESGPQAHIRLAEHITASGIRKLIAIGPNMTAMTAHLSNHISCQCYQTSSDALAELDQAIQTLAAEADCLLIKGSHGSGAHLISQHLITAYANQQTQQETSDAS